MADNYDENKFNLKQDWNWGRVIGKRDSLQHQTMEDDMFTVCLDYLGVQSEEDLTKENIEELLELRKYLEMSAGEGGLGFNTNTSPHFEVLYHSVQMLADEFLDEVEVVSQEVKIDNINEQSHQSSEISLGAELGLTDDEIKEDEEMWDELLGEMGVGKEDKDKKD